MHGNIPLLYNPCLRQQRHMSNKEKCTCDRSKSKLHPSYSDYYRPPLLHHDKMSSTDVDTLPYDLSRLRCRSKTPQ